MIDLFIKISASDIIDILLVAYLIYVIYKLVKGTVAINIFVGLVSIYFIWKFVGMLEMRMLSEILGQFISVGVIALIIVFQQEIRSFLLMLGKLSFGSRRSGAAFFRKLGANTNIVLNIDSILESCVNMSETLTGALIVITRENELKEVLETGEEIKGIISSPIIESIFYKNNPLHDGAMIISQNKIIAARCVLPVTKDPNFPADYGLRHRAAMGISERTDAFTIIVSEQTGKFAYTYKGELFTKVEPAKLKEVLIEEFGTP
ncbi:MAG: diadenylate cyclase CdaA [Bacteroidales bacterium]|nr:diadenylate cyclase CdaA [Bacteroidales bacterium]